jgi:hypothetical protein
MLLTRKLLNQCFLWLSWSHQHFAVLITILSFHHSCFITSIINRITWLLSLVEHELLPFQSTWNHNRYLVGFVSTVVISGTWTTTLPEHMSSQPVFSGVCVVQSFALCVLFCRSLFDLLVIAMCILWMTASCYPFGIFRLFTIHT